MSTATNPRVRVSRHFRFPPDADDGCDLTLIHELQPAWGDFRARAEEAWTKMVAALESALANQ